MTSALLLLPAGLNSILYTKGEKMDFIDEFECSVRVVGKQEPETSTENTRVDKVPLRRGA